MRIKYSRLVRTTLCWLCHDVFTRKLGNILGRLIPEQTINNKFLAIEPIHFLCSIEYTVNIQIILLRAKIKLIESLSSET